MGRKSVKHIICAVRGLPKSRETVTTAIDLALEHKCQLTFCWVIDAEFIGQSLPTLTPLRSAYQQLEDLGEFSMLILCDRAGRRGVEKVDYLIRKGELHTQLQRAASELNADLLVIGRPGPEGGPSRFSPAEFDEFVKRLEGEFKIWVVQVNYSHHE